MKITMLGTGSVYSKSNCAGVLLNAETMLDIGPGTIKQLIKEGYDLNAIQCIVVSHLHMDHYLDFAVLISNLAVGENLHPIQIYGPDHTEETLRSLTTLIDFDHDLASFVDDYCEFYAITDGQEFETPAGTVKAYHVDHGGIEAYAFSINDELAYTGDATHCDNIELLASTYPHMICDCSLIEGNYKHLGVNDINELAEQNPDTTFILTHFRDEVRDYLANNNPHNLQVSDDGYSLTIWKTTTILFFILLML